MRTPKRNKLYRSIIASIVGAGLMTFGAQIQAGETAAHKDPHHLSDGTWINLNGTITAVGPDTFTLDYGQGSIIVEMDDGDRDADAYKLMEGDEVSVAGMIDDDFFQATSIEASSVHVKDIGTTFFASSLDEEALTTLDKSFISIHPIAETMVQGTVTEVNDDEFVVDYGPRQLRVEVDEMLYNPLDDLGYQKIEVGDRVRVTGRIDNDLFEGREVEAETVTELSYDVRASS